MYCLHCKICVLRVRTMPFDYDTRLSMSLPISIFFIRFSLFCFLPNIMFFLSCLVLSCLVFCINPNPEHVPLFSICFCPICYLAYIVLFVILSGHWLLPQSQPLHYTYTFMNYATMLYVLHVSHLI
jgi:hypothetical protein